MHDDYLSQRFPEMRPVRNPPTLSTVNGIGTMAYGQRDYDPETHTYVKTQYFTVLYVPVLALASYRVADAPSGGWYFLGRVPLSPLARGWNYLLLVLAVVGIGLGVWHHQVNTPEYLAAARAREQMARADELAAAGQIGQAARLYRDLAVGRSELAGDALAKFGALLSGPVDTAPAAEAAGYIRTALELRRRLPNTLPDLTERGLKSADKRAEADPRGALQVLDALAPALADPAPINDRQLPWLEKILAKEPDDLEVRGQLAEAYDARRDFTACEKLLIPFRDRLGTTPGARVLGQILARQGKYEEAYALLQPYTEQRLQRLQSAESNYQASIQRIDQEIFTVLKNGKALDFDYQGYKNAPAERQKRLVQDYMDNQLRERLKDDAQLRDAREAVLREAKVVPVALDLGMVILRRAQSEPDPAKRKQELERAEKTFLAVRGVAGRDEEFKLSLGQVYYWLGRLAEGRKQFDEVLEARGRDTMTMLTVSRVLREVGAVSEARALAEEAYNKETNETLKQEAALSRSVLRIDQDDELTWLNRCNSAKPEIRASLSSAKGRKAVRDGDEPAAIQFLREAADQHAQLPENTATLNNGALVQFDLYRLTRERPTLDRGLEMIERALALEPRNSLLVLNAAEIVFEVSLQDLVGTAVDLKALKHGASLELLSHLYRDEAGRAKVVERFRKHDGVAKAISYYERGITLAPRRAHSYSTLASIYGFADDLPALRDLWARLKEADLDLADGRQQATDYFSGKKDETLLKELKTLIAREEEVIKRVRPGGGKTLAVAADELVRELTLLDMTGQPVDLDRVVRLAEQAEAVSPSKATRSLLEGALLTRASQALSREEPAYAAMARRALRSFGPVNLIALSLAGGGELAKKVQANADVRRALELAKQANNAFPREPSEWSWAMFRSVDVAEAERLADVVRQSKSGRLRRQIRERLVPWDVGAALSRAWAAEMAGRPDEARDVIRRLAEQGIPTPFDLP